MEWMLGVQLGRRNLTDFMKNEIALKYEDLIAKRMKERQKKYYGNQYSEKMDFGPNGPESKVESTRTKAELAKIAGTSQGSIQRSKLILQKGTPEQIQRVLAAEKFREYYEKQALKNRSLSGGDKKSDSSIWTKPVNKIDVRQTLAQKAGVGSGTYYRCKTVLDSDNEELKQQMLSGEITINAAYNMVPNSELEKFF